MIIDCHTHLNCEDIDSDPQSHLEACQQVDMAFVLAKGDGPSETANKSVSEYIKDKPKMVGFAVVNAMCDKVNTKYISKLIENGNFKGLILYCCQAGFHPCNSRAMRLYESAQQLGLPVFYHNGGPHSPKAVMEFGQVWQLDEVAREFPDLKIIVGNMGYPFVEQSVELIKKHNNVIGDMTIKSGKLWQIYNTVLRAYEAEIMDKLIFGSGFPHGNVQNCVETLLGFNKLLANSNLPNVPRELIRSIIERDVIKLLEIEL